MMSDIRQLGRSELKARAKWEESLAVKAERERKPQLPTSGQEYLRRSLEKGGFWSSVSKAWNVYLFSRARQDV